MYIYMLLYIQRYTDHDQMYFSIFICVIVENKLTLAPCVALHSICIHYYVDKYILRDVARDRHLSCFHGIIR